MEVAKTTLTPIQAVPERMTVAEGLELVREWEESGLSGRAFARARGLGENRLFYWKKRVAKLAPEGGAPRSSPFVVIDPNDFEVPESNAPQPYGEAIEIVLAQGDVVRIPKGMASVSEILSAVRAGQP